MFLEPDGLTTNRTIKPRTAADLQLGADATASAARVS
jgi:hypothetical protein